VNVISDGIHTEAQRRLRAVARDQGWVIDRDFPGNR
jgi:hypothetical protein